MRDVVICEPLRTAVGGFGGSFKTASADTLGTAVVKTCRTKLSGDLVEDVILEITSEHGHACAWPCCRAVDFGHGKWLSDRPSPRLAPVCDQRSHAGRSGAMDCVAGGADP